MGGTASGPSFSVVIAARNEGEWVRKTVESVLDASDGWPLEIIVVDDGSTDGGCDFVLDEPFRAVGRLVRGEGRGLAEARNRGAALASGERLVFLDAHVRPDRRWLEELSAILEDRSVGLASLAVSNFDFRESVGFTYAFCDENMGITWLGARSDEPYEAPCVTGCCIAMRHDFFVEIGGFDGAQLRWGLEEMELALRTWYLGFRCVVSPRVRVAHRFKTGADRTFTVSWDEYDHNVLRVVLTYFSGRRLAGVIEGLRRRENFARTWALVTGDQAFWQRRARLHRQFRRTEASYFAMFAPELSAFERRVSSLLMEAGLDVGLAPRRSVCLHCGATNVGTHSQCLLCRASLPGSRNGAAGDVYLGTQGCEACLAS